MLAPLAEWIEREWCAPSEAERIPLRLLDVGCGDLLIARLLSSCRVDGYDISPDARIAARDMARSQVHTGTVFDRFASIPSAAYDGVILSSILQYVKVSDRATMFGEVARCLAPGARGVVLTDVPVRGGSRLSDAVDLFGYLESQLGVVNGLRAVVRSAVRSPRKVFPASAGELGSSARAVDLELHQLAVNLSPLRHRRSYVLTSSVSRAPDRGLHQR